MRRLLGKELDCIGRRVQAEFTGPSLPPDITDRLVRLRDREITLRVLSGPQAMRVSGYL